MVSISRWKPETKQELKEWVLNYLKAHQKVRSKDLVEAIKREKKFYRLSSLSTYRLGTILRNLPIERFGTTEKGSFVYYYVLSEPKEKKKAAVG